MRTFAAVLAAIIAVGLVSVSQAQAQGAKSWSAQKGSSKSRLAPRRFSQRDLDRLPVRVTRPDNSGKLIFDGYPLWAARAFQPAQKR
ncbi:MAG: hypothetical protein AAFY27_00645 [Pseudomonadota bacterium]